MSNLESRDLHINWAKMFRLLGSGPTCDSGIESSTCDSANTELRNTRWYKKLVALEYIFSVTMGAYLLLMFPAGGGVPALVEPGYGFSFALSEFLNILVWSLFNVVLLLFFTTIFLEKAFASLCRSFQLDKQVPKGGLLSFLFWSLCISAILFLSLFFEFYIQVTRNAIYPDGNGYFSTQFWKLQTAIFGDFGDDSN